MCGAVSLGYLNAFKPRGTAEGHTESSIDHSKNLHVCFAILRDGATKLK